MHTKNLETHTLKLLRGDRLIWDWEPWKHSTGAKTAKGKAKSSQNARMSPGKKRWRRLCRLLGFDYRSTAKIRCPIDGLTSRIIFGSNDRVSGGDLKASRTRDFRKVSVYITQTFFTTDDGQRLPDSPFNDEKFLRRWLRENPDEFF